MKEPETGSDDYINDNYLNRRKMLKAFGIAALSGTAVSAFSMDKARTAGKSINENIYATVNDMKQDATLEAGNLARTIGYNSVGDGGEAEYIIKTNKPDNDAAIIALNNKFYAVLINVSAVNYQMFGAVGDGVNDDGVQIKIAHAYANQMNVPVINQTGEYWIKATNGIEIMTSVQWGQSVFHIDEKFNTTTTNKFLVTSREKPLPIEFAPETKAKVIEQIKPGVTLIPELIPYRNSLIVVTDDNDRIGVRSGEAYKGRVTKPREEFFLVEEHGRILGDIAWAFKDYTKIVAYPADTSYLVLEGGTFYLSGESTGPASGAYFQMGFSINRSRTIIRNQWVGLEKGSTDKAKSPRKGFYSFAYVYDVLLENVRLLPWEKNRAGNDNDVPQGTYGISGVYALNATFRNITAEGSPVHWGVFGTNLFKNFRVEQCTLNRIDVHFYCWNLYIRDSKIGTNGITITGGGDLFIESTTCRSNSFISFRKDYGAKWDGDIRIRNCRHAPASSGETALLSFAADNFNYKYPIGYGRTIKVEDMVIDFNSVPSSKSTCWLMKTSSFSQATDGQRVFFPYHLEFRNIMVEGREQGVRLLQIPDPQTFKLPKTGSYDSVQLKPNCKMIFEDIHLENLSESPEQVHFLMQNISNVKYKDEYALYPEIRLTRCNDFDAHFGGCIASVAFEQCNITSLTGDEDNLMPGALTFTNCRFQPVVKKDGISYLLGSELGTSFINSVVYAPRSGDTAHPELADQVGFIHINKSVKYNHINTRLGNDILNYCKHQGIKLTPDFIAMLKSHSEMEGYG